MGCYTVCHVQCSYIDSYRIAGYGQGVSGSARARQCSEPLSVQPQHCWIHTCSRIL